MPMICADVTEVAEWRRRIHRAPEFGFEIAGTAAFVAERLRSFGIDVHEDVGGGVVGVLRRGSGARRIGLRADMDALKIHELNTFAHASCHPGLMHACGHDGHTAILLGAARRLASRDDYDATVVFIFQPDEEHGRGARAMIDADLLERFPVDEVYGLHNVPGLPVGTVALRNGPILAAEDNFVITLTGEGGHAARPQGTADVLLAGAQLVTALQSIVSRNVDPQEAAVVSVTEFLTDGTRNVLPKTCTLKGDVRSFQPHLQALVERRMRRLAESVAAGFEVSAEVAYTHEFAPTVNTPAQTARALVAAADAGCKVVGDYPPLMGSDDFGVMLQRRQGAYALLGNGAEGEAGSAPLHSPHYDFNDEALPYGIAYFVALVTGARDPQSV